ncbi:MAG: flagellar motor switch protein FliN [Phycisphaerales bacterium]
MAQEPEETGATQPTPPEDAKSKQAAEALAAAQAAINQLKSEAKGESPKAEADQPAPAAAAESASQPVAAEQPASEQPATAFDLPSFSGKSSSEMPDGMALLNDVNLDVKIELGRTRMVVEDVLRLSEGAVVELDKLAGDPVDIYVNGRHIARGEVLVLNENFCVRISEILAGAEAAAKQIASAAASALSA